MMATAPDHALRMKRLRAVFFALLGKIGPDLPRNDTRRHELTQALVGAASIRGLTPWQMQTLVMRVAQLVPMDAEFGVRLALPARRGDRRDDLATPPQVAAILAASHRVEWTSGPEAFVRERVLSELRRRNWDGWWDTLWKSEASKVICAMQRMARSTVAPDCDGSHPSGAGRHGAFDREVATAVFDRMEAAAR